MTRRSAIDALPASLRALNAHALAACPPVEREALSGALKRRSDYKARGRKAQRNGASFERQVETALEVLRARGVVAWYGHAEPGTVFVGGELRHTSVGGCDWYGVLAGGRAFVVECKRGRKIYRAKGIGPDRAPCIAEHQAAQLTAYATAGAVALLAVDRGDGLRWVQWTDARWDKGALVSEGVTTMEGTMGR